MKEFDFEGVTRGHRALAKLNLKHIGRNYIFMVMVTTDIFLSQGLL